MLIIETTSRECCQPGDLEPVPYSAKAYGHPRHKRCKYCHTDYVLVDAEQLNYQRWEPGWDVPVVPNPKPKTFGWLDSYDSYAPKYYWANWSGFYANGEDLTSKEPTTIKGSEIQAPLVYNKLTHEGKVFKADQYAMEYNPVKFESTPVAKSSNFSDWYEKAKKDLLG